MPPANLQSYIEPYIFLDARIISFSHYLYFAMMIDTFADPLASQCF